MNEVWASHYQKISSEADTANEFDSDFEKLIKEKVEQALSQNPIGKK